MPLSVRLSMMIPSTRPLGSALSSNTSANATVASASSSRLSPWQRHDIITLDHSSKEGAGLSHRESCDLQSGDVDRLNVAAKLLTHDVVSQKFSLDSRRVGLRSVAFVDGHNDGD